MNIHLVLDHELNNTSFITIVALRDIFDSVNDIEMCGHLTKYQSLRCPLERKCSSRPSYFTTNHSDWLALPALPWVSLSQPRNQLSLYCRNLNINRVIEHTPKIIHWRLIILLRLALRDAIMVLCFHHHPFRNRNASVSLLLSLTPNFVMWCLIVSLLSRFNKVSKLVSNDFN